MLKGGPTHHQIESPIFGSLSIWKIVNTEAKRPVILHKDGGVSIIIPFQGVNNTSFNEAKFTSFYDQISKFFDNIEREIVTISFTSRRSNDVESVDSQDLPRFLKPRAEYFDHLAKTNRVFKNDFFLTIFVSTPPVDPRNLVKDFIMKKIFREEPLVNQYKKAFANVEQQVSMCFRIMDEAMTMFSQLGLKYNLLKTKDEYYDLLQEFIRPEKSKIEKIKIESKDASPRQALFSGVRAENKINHFILDDVVHKVYSLDRVPKTIIYGRSFDVLHSIPYEYTYTVSFKTLPHEKSIKTFQWRKLGASSARGADNETILGEDLSKVAKEVRINKAYGDFAFDESSVGANCSINLIVKVKESYIETEMNKNNSSFDEEMRKVDYRLQREAFPSFGGSEWVCEPRTGWAVFCKTIPGLSNMQDSTLKENFLTTNNIAYCLPLWSVKRSPIHDGTNHFIDERGNFVTFDLMDPSFPAWNYFISGETGSGKSVLVNTILTMQFAETYKRNKPIVCIIDVGGENGSYLKFMKLVKGQIINLTGSKKPNIQILEINPDLSMPTIGRVEEIMGEISKFLPQETPEKLRMAIRNMFLNILDKGKNNLDDNEFRALFETCFGIPMEGIERSLFDLKPGQCEPTGKALNLIMGFFEIILSSSPKEYDAYRFYDYEEILSLVLGVYRSTEGRFPRISDLYNLAINGNEKLGLSAVNGDERLGRKLLTKLKSWTSEGAYPMFDLDTDVDLSNDVILVDVKGLQNEPALQLIYTLLFSELFSNKMYNIKDRRKLMIRDEAWAIMSMEKARKYLVEDLRTARKNGFATLTISQFPTDVLFPDRHDGKSILSSIQAHFVGLISKPRMIEDVASELDMTPDVSAMLKQLGQKKEIQPDGSMRTAYSRFMLKIQDEVYILRNILHPFEAQLYSSSDDDIAIIDYYMKVAKTFTDLEELLFFIANKEFVGDAKLIEFLERAGKKNAVKQARGGK